MRTTLLVALMVVAVAVSGCQSAPDEDGIPTAPSTGDGLQLGVQQPVWTVGKHWTWDMNGGRQVTLVVSEETGSAWTVDTADDFEATLEAFHDNDNLGQVRKSDFAHVGDETRMPFQFPLFDGLSWETTALLNVDSTATVSWDGASDPIIRLESDGPWSAEYTYDLDGEWFGYIQYFNEGEAGFRIESTPQSGNFTGELVRADLEQVVNVNGKEGPYQETQTLTFSNAEDADVYNSISISCEQGAGVMAIGPAENAVSTPASTTNDGYTWDFECPTSGSNWGKIGDQPDQGTWGYTIDIASSDAVWSFEAWLVRYERLSI